MSSIHPCHHAPIIGHYRAPLSQKFGTPRQPNLVAVTGMIEMMAPFDKPAAFAGLDDFSHLWLTWQFHHNFIKKSQSANGQSFRAQVRPPRLGGNQKIGVFASRSMYRPSQLGLSVVKLERVEVIDGRALLLISGADMVDGTPIIDIKPYVAYSDALPDAVSGFAPSAPSTFAVTITDTAATEFMRMVQETTLDNPSGTAIAQKRYQVQQQLLLEDIEKIRALIAQDPRPAYRQHQSDQRFTMRYKSVDVSFKQTSENELTILAIKKIA